MATAPPENQNIQAVSKLAIINYLNQKRSFLPKSLPPKLIHDAYDMRAIFGDDIYFHGKSERALRINFHGFKFCGSNRSC